jgi:hypothetical protein
MAKSAKSDDSNASAEAPPPELPNGAQAFPISMLPVAPPPAVMVPQAGFNPNHIVPLPRNGDIIPVSTGIAPATVAALPTMFGLSPENQKARAGVARFQAILGQSMGAVVQGIAAMAAQIETLPDDEATAKAAISLDLDLPRVKALVTELRDLAAKHGLVAAAKEPCRTC